MRHRRFAELPEELHGELVVVNDTKVVPARIPIDSPRGEVLLLERIDGDLWEGLARPTRRLKAGQPLRAVELLEHLGEGRWRLRLDGEPARRRRRSRRTSPRRSTTPRATRRSMRATPAPRPRRRPACTSRPSCSALLDVERVTLHVGLDTFRPVSEETPRGARDPRRALRGRSRPPGSESRAAERVLAVGTTTVRTLETLAHGGPLAGRTELFITPGFEFRRVDALLTNFHLPRSTLLALVMAFAGVEETRRLYRLAVEERYRFYSFGDAMLIL